MYNGISFTNEKECSFDIYCNMDEPQIHYTKLKKKKQTGKTTYFMTPFIWNFQKGQTYRDRKQSSGCLGLGMGLCWGRGECKRFK